ncbi:hypothetical protein CFIMG_007900RA00001 [Ceratocystis fimbriata CBS 114723]|uniref:Reverse transcriptase Ty1/copia-type domain-containing protein n=1 Tax=Ceratocystis fimbriata CBS 114723 TaxID=1035309 RepID=A0A2C5WS01_9PEZI|nr:hypothetical protein CFIMG_007900RA00001 [Ceratocystis fimbriata CBS 114723]
MKGLEQVSTYLGIQITSKPGETSPRQTKYIHDLLSRFDMMTPTSNARTVPMTSQVFSTISTSVGIPLNDSDTQRYQQITGSLQRLSCMIRPGTATSLQKVTWKQ